MKLEECSCLPFIVPRVRVAGWHSETLVISFSSAYCPPIQLGVSIRDAKQFAKQLSRRAGMQQLDLVLILPSTDDCHSAKSDASEV